MHDGGDDDDDECVSGVSQKALIYLGTSNTWSQLPPSFINRYGSEVTISCCEAKSDQYTQLAIRETADSSKSNFESKL